MHEIIAKNLSIHFPVYGAQSRSIKNTILAKATGGIVQVEDGSLPVIRALENINFHLRSGDRLGLLGHNGSGKSTLLRVLAGVYAPTAGSIKVNGTLSSMLSISTGINYDATGKENIYLLGLIAGCSRKQIDSLFDEICEFSELGEYIYLPLKVYSSGMAMRLAFSVATSIQRDILLMDEWLSVGDKEFSEKAGNRLSKILDDAKIFVLASHNETLIRKNCNMILHLDGGKITSLENC
jgi:lipopolysaccharide transport system ATP-binding protein